MPEQWRWPSAKAHIAGGDDRLVMAYPMLSGVGDWPGYLAGTDGAMEAEELIKGHSRTGRPLGCRALVSKLELLTGMSLVPKKPGPAPRVQIK